MFRAAGFQTVFYGTSRTQKNANFKECIMGSLRTVLNLLVFSAKTFFLMFGKVWRNFFYNRIAEETDSYSKAT
jgi:hypothetical protein